MAKTHRFFSGCLVARQSGFGRTVSARLLIIIVILTLTYVLKITWLLIICLRRKPFEKCELRHIFRSVANRQQRLSVGLEGSMSAASATSLPT